MFTKLLTTSGGGRLFPQLLRGVGDWFGVKQVPIERSKFRVLHSYFAF